METWHHGLSTDLKDYPNYRPIGRAGNFSYGHTGEGKSRWYVCDRRTGRIVAWASNTSTAFKIAQQLHAEEN